MAQAKSISLSQFTSAVQTAVKSAVQKHPKFKIDTPQGVTFSYLIRGIPVPESVVANVTFGETQAFANDIATQLLSAQPEAFVDSRAVGTGNGVVYSTGHHVILGIPAVDTLVEK